MARWKPITKSLVDNWIQSMFAGIEIHNKPIFPNRYQIVCILVINARELVMKWFLYKNKKKIFVSNKDSINFNQCLNWVVNILWKSFFVAKANLETLYEYRNKYSHFYTENFEPLLFPIITKSVSCFIDFVKENFGDIIVKNDFVILPIWIKPISAVSYIWESLKKDSKNMISFLKCLKEQSQFLLTEWINESILVDYNFYIDYQKKIDNADIIWQYTNIPTENTIFVNKIEWTKTISWNVKISDDMDASKIKFDTYEEEKQFQEKNYPLTNAQLRKSIKEKYWYKLRSWTTKEIKKYQKDKRYCFACGWETQKKYKKDLVDIIWNSFPDNPRLEHLKIL